MLTLIENEALNDAGDIPPLSEAFTARVMSSLASTDNFSSKPQSYFKRISWYSGLAIAAAVITLCLYIPNLKDTGNKINVANNSFKQQQLELQSDAVKNNDYGTQAKKEATIKLSQVNPPLNAGSVDQSKLPSSTQESEPKSVSVHKDLTLVPSVLSTPESSEAMKRSTNILSFSPQNIPARFKLVKSENNAEKEAIYNYVSQDGKENLDLKVAPYREKMMAIGPTSNITTQASPPSLTRDIQVGDQQFTLTLSSNMPTEELTQLANTIQLITKSRTNSTQ
jgi:hypothetical protein